MFLQYIQAVAANAQWGGQCKSFFVCLSCEVKAATCHPAYLTYLAVRAFYSQTSIYRTLIYRIIAYIERFLYHAGNRMHY